MIETTNSKVAPRLIGVDLRELPDGATLAVTPRGEMYRVGADPQSVGDLLRKLDGKEPIEAFVSKTADPSGENARVIDALMDGGSISCGDPYPGELSWSRFEEEPLDPSKVLSTRLVMVGDDELTTVALRARMTDRFGSVEVIDAARIGDWLTGNDSDNVLVVALLKTFDREFLLKLDETCEVSNTPWTQMHLDRGRGWLGPSIMPGNTANYRDLLGRRLCAADDVQVYEALVSPSAYKLDRLPLESELLWMLSILFIDVERWVAGGPTRMLGWETEADPVSLVITPHPVLPLPERTLTDDAVRFDAEALVDERTGLIHTVRQIEHDPSIPSELNTVQTHVADVRRIYPWTNDHVSGGSAFYDPSAARNAAIGEAVERYCGNWVDGVELTRASFAELRSKGARAVDPEQLVLFSESQYASPGFPFVPFTRDLQVHWVRGCSLTEGRPAWLPASLVFVNWHMAQYQDEPPTNFLNYPGIAAGPNLDAALASAIEEIIERDATMVWWTNRQALPAIELTSELAALWKGSPTDLGQRAWMIHLDNQFDVPVMAGVVENVEQNWFNIGFAARPHPVQAALKAWTEALTLQDGSRDMDDPDGLFRQGIEWGDVDGSLIKPWRADRAYLDSYRSDFRDVVDLMCQQQVFLDPRAREAVRPWTDARPTRSFDDLPKLPDRSLATYKKTLESQGFEIFYADVTTPDVELTGMKVVRVLVPGLCMNFPAAFPCLGGGRIQNTAVQLGWRETALKEEELNYFPLPHA